MNNNYYYCNYTNIILYNNDDDHHHRHHHYHHKKKKKKKKTPCSLVRSKCCKVVLDWLLQRLKAGESETFNSILCQLLLRHHQYCGFYQGVRPSTQAGTVSSPIYRKSIDRRTILFASANALLSFMNYS